MKSAIYRKLSLAAIWLALTPVNSPSQEEPPPGARRTPPPATGGVVQAPALPPVPVKARLQIDTKLLGPSSIIQLEFPKPVVPADKVNTPAAAGFFTTEPEIPGQGTWVTRNQARFHFTSLPPMGTTVRFSIKEGLAYEDGTAIPAGETGAIQVEPFRLLNHTAVNSDSRRTGMHLLIFADDVDPATAAPWLLFSDPVAGKIPVKAVHLRRDEADPFRYLLERDHYENRSGSGGGWSWTQRFNRRAGQPEAQAAPAAPVRHALLVSPLQPLPAGSDWKLEILKGMPNGAANARTLEVSTFAVGAIEGQGLDRYQKPQISKGAISIHFSQPLPKDRPADSYAAFFKLVPEVKDLKIKVVPDGGLIRFESPSLEYGKRYDLTIRSGITSVEGLAMLREETAALTLEPMSPSLAMPEADTAQLAAGRRQWPIHTRNLSSVRVRVKQVSGTDAIRALQGYASTLEEDDYARRGKVKGGDTAFASPVPWSLMPGRVVYNEEHKWQEDMDENHLITLDWNKILPGKAPALLFVSAEGADFLPKGRKHHIVQALVQLTDIGLAWKLTADEAVIYAYSLTTGAPLTGTSLNLYNAESTSLASHTTAADGTTRVPRVNGGIVLMASRGADQFTVAFDKTLPRTSLYSFPVQLDWSPARDFRRQALMFTDRGLYRPGEEVHLKGIVRRRLDTDIRMAEESSAEFTIKDADDRALLTKTVTLSGFGTFDESFKLPGEKVGQFRAELHFPKPEKPATKADEPKKEESVEAQDDNDSLVENRDYDGDGGGDDADRTFTKYFRVEEFRRNTFEISLPAPQPPPGAASSEVALSARYFMGQPLSDASIQWSIGTSDTGFYPDKYRDFLFGDHSGYDPYYWSYYYGWRGRYENDGVRRESAFDQAETKIGPDGRASLPVNIPTREFPASQRITVTAEVTDVNQQTLTESCSFTVHPAAIHVGVGRVDAIQRTGQPCTLNLVALDEKGESLTKPQTVSLTLEHEAWDTVRTVSANGIQQTQSVAHRTVFLTKEITIAPATEAKKTTPFAFTPDKSGTWHVKLEGADEDGRATATRSQFYVCGKGEYPWEYEEGGRIRLVPEKPAWKPGDKARILVMTPIEGTALVTVERAKVLRSFTVPLKLDQPVVEVPIEDADAPNVYVSVAVIKGLADNQRDVKEPVLKLGYCELKVEDTRDTLTVSPVVTQDPVRPGESAEVTITVNDRDGKPAGGAEVTLWAVDEGVLSVMGYENPDAGKHFLPSLGLGVRFGTSLSLYLPEDEERMAWANKGFTIGGGDGEDQSGDPSKLRKDFNPLAFWQGTLTTAADGRTTARFKTPDTLTRYRVLALAISGARRFGTGVSALTVNKPLMVEPVVPRFANVGDQLTPKAVVHNTSKYGGRFLVTLETSDHAAFAAPDTARTNVTRQVDLAAGQTKAVTFDLGFRHFGEAVWKWRAEPVTLTPEAPAAERAQLVDFVESRFPVQFPGPLLSQQRTAVLSLGTPVELLDGFDPAIIAKAARLEVEISASRFVEAAEALEYLLVYPYGCVEQTSSSTLPWIAATRLKGHLPRLGKTDSEIKRMIQAGADRLLSMQTDSGGLSYWPGDNNPLPWATCLGGQVILMARDAGAAIPEEAIEGISKYLSEHLQKSIGNFSTASSVDAALSLYTLTMAGKPDPGYTARLYDLRTALTGAARSYLALTFAREGTPEAKARAKTLLEIESPAGEKEPYEWFHYDYRTPLRLYAWCHTDPANPKAAELMDSLSRQRDRHGHWGNTFTNAWVLNAFGAWAAFAEEATAPPAVALAGWTASAFSLTKQEPARFLNIVPEEKLPHNLLATITGGKRAYAHVKLTGQPEIMPLRKADNGLSISRTYELIGQDGKPALFANPRVGDRVLISLSVHVPANIYYVAIDDALPCTFEAIQPDFGSQGSTAAAEAETKDWRWWVSNHRELRDNRALFFCDYVHGPQRYDLRYLARVTGVGDVMAPQAKVEAMYEPERYGLSESLRIRTLPRQGAENETASR